MQFRVFADTGGLLHEKSEICILCREMVRDIELP